GDAVGGARDGGGDVGAVAVAVRRGAAADGVVAVRGPSADLPVRDADAGVDDVHGHTAARGVGVGVRAGEREGRLVDAVQAPGGVGLRDVGQLDLLVLLHRGDRRVGRESSGL